MFDYIVGITDTKHLSEFYNQTWFSEPLNPLQPFIYIGRALSPVHGVTTSLLLLPHLGSPHPADSAPWRSPLRLQESTSDTRNGVRMDSRLDQVGCEEPCAAVCVLVADRPQDSAHRVLTAGVSAGGCGSCAATDWLSAAGCSGCWSQAEGRDPAASSPST